MAGETPDYFGSLLSDLTSVGTAYFNSQAQSNAQVDTLKAQIALQKQANDQYAQSLGQLGVWYSQNQATLTKVAEWGLVIVGACVAGFVLYEFTKRRR